MRTIGVVTTSRADYGIYRPIMRKIEQNSALELATIVSGTHLSEKFGMSVTDIEADGFTVAKKVELPITSDTPSDITATMAAATERFGRLFSEWRPELLMVLGDRFEMHAAALAALPFKIPVAHIHGGEVTEGAIDDALRHSMTKLSHLHFTATDEYARRVRQLGEADWRITVSGAPGLDNLDAFELPSAQEIGKHLGLDLSTPPILATFHPVTLEFEDTEFHIANLLEALTTASAPIVFSAPNADTSSKIIRHSIDKFVAEHPNSLLVENLGTFNYFGLMKGALAMIGNSSSGIIEAASFKLPVVNIGTRQKGRISGENVIGSTYDSNAIRRALARASDPKFKNSLADMVNPYGDGKAAQRIVDIICDVPLDMRLLVKSFADLTIFPNASNARG